MGYSSQANMTLLDTKLFSYSTFFRIPSQPLLAGAGQFTFDLVAFGTSTDVFSNIFLSMRPSTNNFAVIDTVFAGASGLNNAGGAYFPEFGAQVSQGANPANQMIFMDQWQHLFVSANGLPEDQHVFTPFSNFIIHKQYNIWLGCVDALANSNWTHGFHSYDPDVLDNTTDRFITSINMVVQNKILGIPTLPDFAVANNHLAPATSPRIEFANTFIWFGNYINGTSENISKFAYIGDDGLPWPADTTGALAIGAFGQPSFFFKGGKDEFQINKGTAGPMILTGTSSDFVPPPGSPSALGPGV